MGIRKTAGMRPWDGASVVITPGKYRLRIVETEEGLTSASIEKAVVTFEVVEDLKGGKKFKGERVKGHYAYDGQGASRTLNLALALGVPIPDDDEEGEIDFDPKNFVGHEIIGRIENNPDKTDPKKIWNNITGEEPLPTAPAKEAPADVAEKLKKKAS